MPPRYVLIANPGTRRCETYRRELAAFWAARGATPEVEVVPGRRWPGGTAIWTGCRRSTDPPSSGWSRRARTTTSTRLLLEAGARDDPSRAAVRLARRCHCRRACSFGPACGTAGSAAYSRVCTSRSPPARTCGRRPARWPSPRCSTRRRPAGGCTRPACRCRWLENPADVFPVLDRRRPGRWPTAYVKLNTGSSATGMASSARPPTRYTSGTTTLAELGGGFFNSRRLRR